MNDPNTDPHPTNPVADPADETRAKRFWVSLVLLLMGLQVTIGVLAFQLAVGNPSMAVVPDYHRSALNWDKAKEAKLAAQKMGWTVRISTSKTDEETNLRTVEISITDKHSQPIDQLTITGTAYRHAKADDVQSFATTWEDDRYFAMVPMYTSGLWQIDLTIDGADHPVTESFSIDLSNP